MFKKFLLLKRKKKITLVGPKNPPIRIFWKKNPVRVRFSFFFPYPIKTWTFKLKFFPPAETFLLFLLFSFFYMCIFKP